MRGSAPSILSPFTLVIVETAPGRGQWKDATQHLQTYGFWASFNEPAFLATKDALEGTDVSHMNEPDPVHRSPMNAAPNQYSRGRDRNAEKSTMHRCKEQTASEVAAWQSYVREPRYIVFREKQRGVRNLKDMQACIREAGEKIEVRLPEGEWAHGLAGVSSQQDGSQTEFSYTTKKIGVGATVCSRPDLAGYGSYSLIGGTDGKIVSSDMLTGDDFTTALIINGPSTVGNDKHFSFKDFPAARRMGLPDYLTKWGWYRTDNFAMIRYYLFEYYNYI